jgi:hypothetical protein
MNCADVSITGEEFSSAKLIKQMYHKNLASFLTTVSEEEVTGNLQTMAAFVRFVKAIPGRQQTGNPSPGVTSTPTTTTGQSSAGFQHGKKKYFDFLLAGSSNLDALVPNKVPNVPQATEKEARPPKMCMVGALAPALTKAEADRKLDSLFISFKKIMNRDVTESRMLVCETIYALTTEGNRLEAVLKCLGDAAKEYLSEKANNISGLASMSLLKGINQLWLKWQESMDELSFTFVFVKNRKEYSEDNVRRQLLKTFKDNVIMPNGCHHIRIRGRKRFAPPVHVINIGLRATLVFEATRTKPLQLSTQNSDVIKSCLAMLTTLGLDQDMKDIFVGLRTRIRS